MSLTQLPTVRIFVTVDEEIYHVVDISGASNGLDIRRCIISKLKDKLTLDDQSFESRFSQHSIYCYEIGQSIPYGKVLSDEGLYEICQRTGMPSADLKFYVSVD